MKKTMALLLAIMLALPMMACGEGSDVLVDAFIERAGIEADDGLRVKIADFMEENYISAPVLEMIDAARLARYAQHLAEDLPISYSDMTEAESAPMPEGAKILQLAVMVPQGAAMESALIDFERHLAYYDETFPVPEDVCRAAYGGALSDADAEGLLEILGGMTLEDRVGDLDVVDLNAICVIVAWDGGVTRCTAAGEGLPEDFTSSVRALLDAGRAAARGGNE